MSAWMGVGSQRKHMLSSVEWTLLVPPLFSAVTWQQEGCRFNSHCLCFIHQSNHNSESSLGMSECVWNCVCLSAISNPADALRQVGGFPAEVVRDDGWTDE